MRQVQGKVLGLLVAVVLLSACSGDEPAVTRSEDGDVAMLGRAEAAAAAVPAMDGIADVEGVTVTGVGRVSGRPDVLRATLGVEVERPTVQEAVEVANEQAEQLLAALRDAGVAEEDIQTREFTVQPRMEHRPDQPPELRGYAVRNLVEATLRDVERAGEVLGAAVAAAGDAARVESVRFDLEDNDEQLAAARERAFEDARAKAEDYARLAGRDLGPVQSIVESSSTTPPVASFLEESAARAAPAPPIAPGQQEVAVHVTAVWALE